MAKLACSAFSVPLWQIPQRLCGRLIPEMPSIERLSTPVGVLTVVTNADALLAIRFGDAPDLRGRFDARPPLHVDVIARLRAYFDGDRAALDEIPVEPGGTAFQ